MDRRIGAMMQIERMDNPPTEHVCPDSVGQILLEGRVAAACQFFCQLTSSGKLGNRAHPFFRFNVIQVTLIQIRITQVRSARQVGFHLLGSISNKHREKRGFSLSLFRDHRTFFRVAKKITAIQERIDAIIVRLMVVFDGGVIMTLRTFHIDAEKKPANIASYRMRFC